VSRYLRAALVIFALVIGLMVLFHVVAPQWMSSLSHTIHGR
jgi:hypothetical protein